jgi:hypothetical protein
VLPAPRGDLDTIAGVAQGSLHGVDHVGVSMVHSDGRLETVSATDQLVWELDALQYRLRILMERYRMTEARAFQFLARASQTSDLKIRDLAQETVDTVDDHHAGSPELPS